MRNIVICNDSRAPLEKRCISRQGLEAVDKLIENEAYLSIAKQLLDTEEIRLGYGQIFFREGLTDSRHSEHPWQGYHIDNATNSPLPPHPDWQRYGYVLNRYLPT